jgi:subtilisin-like proprotein convertase family protein
VAFLLMAHVATVLAVDSAATALPAVPGSEAEPNDGPGGASPIVSGQRIRAPLFPKGDVDFYRFSAKAGERVFAAVMTSGSAGDSTDSQLRLLGGDGGTVIEFDDDNGSFAALSSSIAGAAIPADGVYYLKVNDFTAGTTTERPYDLYFQLRSGAPTAEVEPNNAPAQANPIGVGYVAGKRNPAEAPEQDWYSMNLNAGDTVFFSLDLDPERDGTSWNGRLGFALAGDVGNQVLAIDDAGTGDVAPNPNIPSEATFMTVAKSGTYFAFVDSATAATGGPTATYRLSATVLPASRPSCRTYSTAAGSPLADGGTAEFSIAAPDPARLDRVALGLDLTHAQMADLDISLRAPNGNEVAIATDVGAATPGGQTHLEAVFDQNAAISPQFTVLRPLMLQPELAGRLSWFEGQQAAGTWKVVIRDDTATNTGSLARADLILCGQPEEEPAPQLYAADFEAGDEGFAHSGPKDEWERGTPATVATATSNAVAGLGSCAQGSACFKTDLDGTYELESSQDLVSPPISLGGVTGKVNLSWEQWSQVENATFDHASVTVEEDGGGNPRTLFTWLDGDMKASLGNPSVNVPTAAGWGLRRADISEYAGKTIRLRFHLDSDNTIAYAGMAVDAIRITGHRDAPSAPAAAVLSGLKIQPKRFHVAGATKTKAKASKKGKARGGASVSYTDSQAAVATLTVLRQLPGRKIKGKCTKSKPASKSKPRCKRYLPLGSFTHADVAGANKLKFSGRLKGRGLKPGRYKLAVVAKGADGKASNTLEAPFTVLP